MHQGAGPGTELASGVGCRAAKAVWKSKFQIFQLFATLETGKQLMSKKTDHKNSQDQRAVLAFLNEESGRLNRFCCYDTNSWQDAKAAGLSCLFVSVKLKPSNNSGPSLRKSFQGRGLPCF